MKSLDDIWDEYINNDKLKSQTISDLAWHIDNDIDPAGAITMATDMGLKELGPHIASQLENEDDYIRELSVGCLLGGLRLSEYAEKGFKMAREDSYDNVRALALFSLGEVLDKIEDKNLQFKIASYIYHVLTKVDLDLYESFRGEAYYSILIAMGIPASERPRVRDLDNSIDSFLVEQFKKKYGI